MTSGSDQNGNAPAPLPPPPSATDAATPPPLDANGQPAAVPPAGTAPGALPGTDAAANPNAPRSREFQGDDVSQVLRLLARQAKINLVVSDAVQGTVNMRLEDVTALRAIEIICQAKGLTLTQLSGVYYVKTLAEKAAEPTEAGSYTFSYARAPQTVALLTGQLVNKASPPQVDERTNTVFYQEVKSNIDRIRGFLRQIDRPTKQVMIDARLVEVTNNPSQSYGINWAGVFGSAGSPKTFRYGGSTLPDATTGRRAVAFNTDGSVVLNDFVREGGTTSPPGFLGNLGRQFAILSIPQFSATIRFLNEDADAEFLANPRVVTADNQEATIKIIRKQPVPQLNFNQQTAEAVFSGFQDKTFGNTLIVKPSINKDNYITLSVKPEISNRVGDQTFNYQGTTVSSPIIDSRSLDASVLIKSGCTLAVGGLLQDETAKQATKVPVLGDIPILGYLFQEHVNVRNKRNLLIFVTPTIINSIYGTGLEDQITGLKGSTLTHEYADINGWRNNAKGEVRLVKTPDRQIAGEYPVPGSADCKGVRRPSFKDSATYRGE